MPTPRLPTSPSPSTSTGVVLFFILKAIATAQKGFGGLKGDMELLSSEEAEQLRKEGKSRKEIKAILEQRAAEKKAAEEAAKAAEEAAAAAAKPETTDDLLREIRDLLRAQAAAAAESKTSAEE